MLRPLESRLLAIGIVTDPPARSARATCQPGWSYLERLHPATIELGLERVAAVRDRLGLAPEFPLITVGGTNGKGSTCAMLESCPALRRLPRRLLHLAPSAALQRARAHRRGRGRRTQPWSPHSSAWSRRVGDFSLTYFEFGTLAAVLLFVEARLDVAVLEVGLGGRLDAVNVFEPDCAVVTSIGLDHIDYLGDTREQIGLEKAGIFRTGRPAVVADPDPPATLIEHAKEAQARALLDRSRFWCATPRWRVDLLELGGTRRGLPRPDLRGNHQLGNAAAALAALDCVRDRLPVDMGAIRRGLVEVELPARFQVLPGRPAVILDVAHNPHAAQRLLENLKLMDSQQRGGFSYTIAVFAMLEGQGHFRCREDCGSVHRPMASRTSSWATRCNRRAHRLGPCRCGSKWRRYPRASHGRRGLPSRERIGGSE